MEAGTQILVGVDCTSSMRPALGEVRRRNSKIINALYSAIPRLEMGFVAIGDDPPETGGYMTKVGGFYRDWEQAKRFLEGVPDAYGGDSDECYELALHQMSRMDWNKDAKKVVVFIGDVYPHPVNHRKNPRKLDWREQVTALARQGVIIHGVQALAHYREASFWSELPRLGGGVHLRLDQWSHLEALLMGVAHFTVGGVGTLGEFEKQRGVLPTGVHRGFDALAGRTRVRKRSDGRKATDPSRFQVLTVDSLVPQDVREFSVELGLISDPSHFARVMRGHIFYAHTERNEELRPTHEVVVQDRNTDDFFSGAEAREWLGCPYGDSKKIPPNPLGENYLVWFQSKSMNRKLKPGQQIMVEMTDEMMTHE